MHKLHGFERLGDGVSERHLTEETKKGGGLQYLLSLTMASSDCLQDQRILENKDLNQDNISTYNPSNDLESFNYDDMLNVVSYCSISLGYDLNIQDIFISFLSPVGGSLNLLVLITAHKKAGLRRSGRSQQTNSRYYYFRYNNTISGVTTPGQTSSSSFSISPWQTQSCL